MFLTYALGILAVGAFLRLFLLGQPVFHPDEAIHANFSYHFDTYSYDPTYHGPLLYHLVSLTMRIFGDSDFTARLVPAVLGIGLILLVLFSARNWLDDRATLWSAALIAISPVMVSYSRRLLHDALVLVLTFGAVLYFQTAREKRAGTAAGFEARIGVVALLALFMATKANAFFVIAMLIAFWIATVLPTRGSPEFDKTFKYLPVIAFLVVGVTAGFAYRHIPDQIKTKEAMLKYVCILWSFAMLMWVAFCPPRYDDELKALRDGELPEGETTEVAARRNLIFAVITPVIALLVGAFLFCFLYGHGYLWFQDMKNGQWDRFHGYWSDIVTSMPRMKEYWAGQQDKPRLPGPHDYYIILMALYELPILLAAVGGVWHASKHRTPFTDLLLWWAFTSFAAYAMANEKVPWLMTHQILPFALLAGLWLGQLRIEKTAVRNGLAAATFFGAIFLLRGTIATNFSRPADNHEPMVYAQTSETFGDAFFAALNKSLDTKEGMSGNIWFHNDRQWPCAWYMRKIRREHGIDALYGAVPDNNPGPAFLRMSVATVQSWEELQKKGRFPHWRTWSRLPGQPAVQNPPGVEGVPSDFLVWQRASWPALRPDRFLRWWWTRDASDPQSPDHNQDNRLKDGTRDPLRGKFLSEYSHIPTVVATAK